jgi:hypothetical protein
MRTLLTKSGEAILIRAKEKTTVVRFRISETHRASDGYIGDVSDFLQR